MAKKDEALEEVVTVPEIKDMPGVEKVLTKEPVEYEIKTDMGKVRPIVILSLMNRQARRQLERDLRAKAEMPKVPIVVRNPLSASETTDRVADNLIKWYEETRTHFPAKTLAEFLDDAAGKVLEQAYAQGRPLPREIVREAIGRLWQQTAPKQAAKAK